MRIRAPRPHKNGLYVGHFVKVVGEGVFHVGIFVARETEVILGGGGGNEGVDFGERVRGHYVDRAEEGGERPGIRREGRKEKDQQDKAVLATIVGYGDFGEAVSGK